MTIARSTLMLALCGAPLCAGAQAQQRLDPARMLPMRAEVRHAGTVDVTTGRWTRPDQALPEASPKVIYRNNCTWQVQGYYAGMELCEDLYDEGRVPSTSDPNAPLGAQDFNQVGSFEISYCTNAGPQGPAGYDIDVAFYDKLLGDCVGGVAPTPPHSSLTATAYFALAGLGLPGSTSVGFQACWVVGLNVSNSGWTMASDGEGTFDNDPPQDKFIWMQRQNTWASPLGYPSATPDGFVIAGEPAAGGYGSCSYNIACGTDPIFGNSCGTGLDTFDAAWINVDGIAAGDTSGTTPAGCPNAVSQYGFGTNCYFFGGYPTNTFTSYWLVLEEDRPVVACGQTNSCGQNPALSANVTTLDISLSGPGTWDVSLGPVPAAPNPGILIYGVAGFVSTPITTAFGNLCINPFFRATSTATVPNSTTGDCANPSQYVWDFGSFVAANDGTNGINWGNQIVLQAWYRDPSNPGTANFSVTAGPFGPLTGGSPPPAPTISGFSPNFGAEGTALTVNGGGFGGVPSDVVVLISGGRSFANVSGFVPGQLNSTLLPVGPAASNGTGVGPITVIRGFGSSLPNSGFVTGAISSVASQTRLILNGSGSNSVAPFSLGPSSNNTVNDNSGAPLPGGLTLDMTGVGGNALEVQLAFKVSGVFRTFETRLDFAGGAPTSADRAEHLAAQLALQFGAQGLSTSFSVSSVRVSMSGSTYGSAVIKGS